MDDNLIPLFAIVFMFGVPCAVWCISRVLAHQERMEMLRHGIVPPPNARDYRRAMKCGWTPGPTQQAQSNQYDYYQSQDFYAQAQLRKGVLVAFIGLALLIGLSFIGYRGDAPYRYGPWLLGGLIPLFVGIAQVIGAVLSGASFGPASGQRRFGPASGGTNSGSARQTASPPPGPTYGGWRPGSTPEIEKPASPPDYRG
jgi:hypothetical protein